MKLPSPTHLSLLAYLLSEDEDTNKIEAEEELQTIPKESKPIEIVHGIEEKELTVNESRFNLFVDEFKDSMKKLGQASYDKNNKKFSLELTSRAMRDLMFELAKNQKDSVEEWQTIVNNIVNVSKTVTQHFGTGYMFELFSTLTGDKLIKLEVKDGIVLYDDTIKY